MKNPYLDQTVDSTIKDNYGLSVERKTNFNLSEGITVDYVNPANIVYSYTDDPNFEDIYYIGEVKNMSLSEVKRQFPYLSDKELEEIQKYPGRNSYTDNTWWGQSTKDQVQVLYFR